MIGKWIQEIRANKHVIGHVARNVHHPRRVHVATRAYTDGLLRQDALFVKQAVDDVTDAVRHTNISAKVVHRLTTHTRATPDWAAKFMRGLGEAHERDSELTGLHRAYSELMDLHNNEVGIGAALTFLKRGAPGGEQALEGAVLRAVSQGKALVLDAKTLPPRPSTVAELNAVLKSPLADDADLLRAIGTTTR